MLCYSVEDIACRNTRGNPGTLIRPQERFESVPYYTDDRNGPPEVNLTSIVVSKLLYPLIKCNFQQPRVLSRVPSDLYDIKVV